MRYAFTFLAARRWAGVGLALAAEVAILVALAELTPSAVIGIPAAVATGIAGTVAVVYGVVDGALLALAGATAFGFAGGWSAGEVASLAVWPGVVALAGLVGRRVERQRVAFRHVMVARELERERLALELHDQTAQELAAALFRLRGVEQAADPAEAALAAAAARELIQETIRSVRALAVDLRPKALDDFGLAPAVERLVETVAERDGIAVELDAGAVGRLPKELEVALYRIVQDALAYAVSRHAERVCVTFERHTARVAVLVEERGASGPPTAADGDLRALEERARLLGGRAAVEGSAIRVELPVWPE
jgi:signal transduction histidine kinase